VERVGFHQADSRGCSRTENMFGSALPRTKGGEPEEERRNGRKGRSGRRRRAGWVERWRGGRGRLTRAKDGTNRKENEESKTRKKGSLISIWEGS